jgi:hypothetical protein
MISSGILLTFIHIVYNIHIYIYTVYIYTVYIYIIIYMGIIFNYPRTGNPMIDQPGSMEQRDFCAFWYRDGGPFPEPFVRALNATPLATAHG